MRDKAGFRFVASTLRTHGVLGTHQIALDTRYSTASATSCSAGASFI
jgi:vancomycin permeability regulator SanA